MGTTDLQNHHHHFFPAKTAVFECFFCFFRTCVCMYPAKSGWFGRRSPETCCLRRDKLVTSKRARKVRRLVLPFRKLTWLAGISPFSIGNTSTQLVHFPASYVSLPECKCCVEKQEPPSQQSTPSKKEAFWCKVIQRMSVCKGLILALEIPKIHQLFFWGSNKKNHQFHSMFIHITNPSSTPLPSVFSCRSPTTTPTHQPTSWRLCANGGVPNWSLPIWYLHLSTRRPEVFGGWWNQLSNGSG